MTLEKIRVIAGAILMLPFFLFMGAWIISDVVADLRRGNWRDVVLPAIFVSAFAGAFLLTGVSR